MKFRRLFESYKIGGMELRNRLVMSPMSTNYAKDGYVTKKMRDYYRERARGGVGLIIVEDAMVDYSLGRHLMYPLSIDDEKFLPGLRDLAEAIKAEGAKVALQINHAGRKAGRVAATGCLEYTKGKLPVAPSSVAHPAPGYVVPRELTGAEIEELIEKFADGARRAKDAGFDAVSIHCAHMYLINQFLTPIANKRIDEYGGDFERRLKFLLKTIESVRNRVGEDYPILCRINGEEPMEGALKLEDNKQIAKRLEEAGVQAISVSYGNSGIILRSPGFVSSIAPMRMPRGCLIHFAENIKREIRLPVMAGGRINNPELAEQILEKGKADLIFLGRALIADPSFPQKAAEGRQDDIRPCIACLQGCGRRLEQDSELGITCLVNPAVGREEELRINPAQQRKKVLIAGGGPAGMEAAAVAALRGHKVLLYEEGRDLGGQMQIAQVPPGKGEISNLIEYLKNQVRKLGVEVELEKTVTLEIVEQIRPDVVIVATGAEPLIPEIPGIDGENVVTATDVLKGAVQVKGRICVVGGGQVGAETAEFLASQGKLQVTIVEMMAQIASDMAHAPKKLLLFSLEDQGVKVLTQTKVKQVTDEGVVVAKMGKEEFLEADTVVLAAGAKSNRTLFETLEGRVPELYQIGDCLKVRKMLDAIAEGREIAGAI